MRYYVKVILEDGRISQSNSCFSTLEEAKVYARAMKRRGGEPTIYEIELKEV